jgi:hypothetical protein
MNGLRHGDGRTGEGCRGREPIGRSDVEAHEPRHGGGGESDTRENGGDEAKGGNEFGPPLRRAGPHCQRRFDQEQAIGLYLIFTLSLRDVE